MAAASSAANAVDAAAESQASKIDVENLDQQMMTELGKKLMAGLDIKDRSYHLKSYPKCFVGSEAVQWMVKEGMVSDPTDAVNLGNVLLSANIFRHVTRDHAFKNEFLFYRFTEHEPNKGVVAKKEDGSDVSWLDFLQRGFESKGVADQNPRLPRERAPTQGLVAGEFQVDKAMEKLEVSPLDKHNARLLDNVHPVKWIDPVSSGKYNMVVIGAGAGGLVTAAGAAGVGARVALIEKNLLGGDCLNVGCVPSKALLKCAKVAHEVRNAGQFGVTVSGTVTVDFAKVMERMRKLRADISKNDSAQRFSKDLGVDVFIGEGKFTSPNTVVVNGQTLTFAKACIATGGSAAVPKVPGLADVPYLTNATVWNLTSLPPRMAVVGAGPIGCELAQAFQRFGSAVSVLVRSDGILPKEDKEAAAVVLRSMKSDGITFEFGTKIRGLRLLKRADQREDSKTTPFPIIGIDVEVGGVNRTIEVDAILFATGRAPNVNNIGLEAAGVEFDPVNGVKVNDFLQSTQKHIFSVGDACCKYQFTHVADWTARTVIRNALFYGAGRLSSLLIPWSTFTEPEVAHVGLYEADCIERNIKYTVYTKHFHDVDRAILDNDTEGFVKVVCRDASDEILGATIVGAHAGDMISEITLAMQTKTGLGKLATVIHPYPTTADAIRACGDLYNKTRLTLVVKGLFRNLMAFQRR